MAVLRQTKQEGQVNHFGSVTTQRVEITKETEVEPGQITEIVFIEHNDETLIMEIPAAKELYKKLFNALEDFENDN